MTVLAARLPGITFEARTPPVPSALPRMDIAGLVGLAAAGPVHVPVAVEDATRFHDIFGEDLVLARDDLTRERVYAELPAAVRAFFRNGGVRCWVVRVAGATAVANRFVVPGLLTASPLPASPGVAATVAFARSPGSWSDSLLVNTSLTLTPLRVVSTTAAPGFSVSGAKPGDLIRLSYPSGIVGFQAVPASRSLRGAGEVAVPNATHWFRELDFAGDVSPTSPPDAIVWLPVPVAVAWMNGDAPEPPLPIARWGAQDSTLLIELDRGALAGVQPGSWIRIEAAVPPADTTPVLLVQVDDIRAAESSSSPEPVWLITTHAWWIIAGTTTPASVQGIAPSAAVVTFELWTRDRTGRAPRLSDLGLSAPHERYFGQLPDDELVYRKDPLRPARLEEVPPRLLDAVLTPRFPLATLSATADPIRRPPPSAIAWPLFLPLGVRGPVHEQFDAFYQPPLAHAASAEVRDGLTSFDAALFVDPELASTRTEMLMTEAFQVQHVEPAPDDLWLSIGRQLKGMHALLPISEVSMIAVPDVLQRPWFAAPSELVPLEAPELVSVGVTDCTVNVDWTAVASSPPDVEVTYILQAGLDPRFATIARTWTTTELSFAHDVCLFEGCPARVFYRVRAVSPRLGIGPWSNALWIVLPPSSFERCPDDQPAAPSPLVINEERNRIAIEWGAVPGADVVYTLERSSEPEFASPTVVFVGTATRFEILLGAEPVVYFRVSAQVAGRWSPWSATAFAGTIRSDAMVVEAVEEFDDQDERRLMSVHLAATRMCAARGDLHAVLSVPLHYRDDRARSYASLLADALSDDGPAVVSYASLFHPWVVVRESTGRADLSTWPIAPDGPVCGVIARRTIQSAAWYSPANHPFSGVVDLRPDVSRAIPPLLESRISPIWQQPAGFSLVDALTLHRGELGTLNVRRLMIVLRRLVMREGPAMVFRANDDSLRRFVQREFEQILGDLFVRGAFAGLSHEEGYRVVADDSVNTPQSIDMGRFIVELRVAPSQPLTFLTVRLVQEGGTLVAAEAG
jgi:hypothetical protein